MLPLTQTRGAAGDVHRGAGGEGVMTGAPEPYFERFRHTYPSGTVVMSFYAGGAPLAVVEAVEVHW